MSIYLSPQPGEPTSGDTPEPFATHDPAILALAPKAVWKHLANLALLGTAEETSNYIHELAVANGLGPSTSWSGQYPITDEQGNILYQIPSRGTGTEAAERIAFHAMLMHANDMRSFARERIENPTAVLTIEQRTVESVACSVVTASPTSPRTESRIGLAMICALIEGHQFLDHGPIDLFISASPELDESRRVYLYDRWLVDLEGTDASRIFIAARGARHAEAVSEGLERAPAPSGHVPCQFVVSGFPGANSVFNPGEGRGVPLNCIFIASAAVGVVPDKIAVIRSEGSNGALPNSAEIIAWIPQSEATDIVARFASQRHESAEPVQLAEQYRPQITYSARILAEAPAPFSKAAFETITGGLQQTPIGVAERSELFPDGLHTYLCFTGFEADRDVRISYVVSSANHDKSEGLVRGIGLRQAMHGFMMLATQRAACWEEKPDNPLVVQLRRIAETVGLAPLALAGYPYSPPIARLQSSVQDSGGSVSIGATVLDPHTENAAIVISSAEKTWSLVSAFVLSMAKPGVLPVDKNFEIKPRE